MALFSPHSAIVHDLEDIVKQALANRKTLGTSIPPSWHSFPKLPTQLCNPKGNLHSCYQNREIDCPKFSISRVGNNHSWVDLWNQRRFFLQCQVPLPLAFLGLAGWMRCHCRPVSPVAPARQGTMAKSKRSWDQWTISWTATPFKSFWAQKRAWRLDLKGRFSTKAGMDNRN